MPIWKLHTKAIKLPEAIPDASEYLKKHSDLTVLLWSLFNFCVDTTTGKVALFPCTVQVNDGSDASTLNVFVGHWSMVQQVMVNLFTGFRNGIRQQDIRRAILPLTIGGLHKQDMRKLVRLSGTNEVNAPRLLDHSHFMIPEEMLFAFATVLEPFRTVSELLQSEHKRNPSAFCEDVTFTMERLKTANLFVSAWTVTKVFQSNTPNWFELKQRPAVYDDNTPAFGIPYWTELVERVHEAFGRFRKTLPSPVKHLKNFWTLSDEPVLDRAQIEARFYYGVVNDVPENRYTDHNQAAKRRKRLYTEICMERGVRPPGRGRPRTPEKPIREKVEMVRALIDETSGIRRMKRNRTMTESGTAARPQQISSVLPKLNLQTCIQELIGTPRGPT